MSETPHEHDHDKKPELSDEEKVRRTAHIVLDGLTAEDIDNGTEAAGSEEGEAMDLVFSKLLEIDAIEVLLDEEADELELDISGLLGGVLVVVRQLVADLAGRDGLSQEDVIAAVRGKIDAAG